MQIAVNARFLLPGGQLEGLGRYTAEVVDRMAAAHPDDTFHLLFDRPHDPRWTARPNVVPHELFPPARHPVLFLWWFELPVAGWLRRYRPDVLFSPDGFTTLRTDVPRVTVIHDLAFEHFPRDIFPAQRWHYRTMTPRFVAASRTVMTVSQATAEDIVATYGTERAKIAVASPGISPGLVPAPLPAVDAVRDRWAGGEEYFLSVGAIQPRKNLPRLLRAFDGYKTATGRPTKLLLAGRRAWKTEAVEDAIAAMRHRTDVVLTGPVTDAQLSALYSGALATVFISLFEGFGLPVVEAMACGSPVITSMTSSLPEAAGGAAVLVDPTDVEAVRHALAAVAADDALRAERRQAGAARVARLSWDNTAETVWQELVRAASS